ncbi:MAG: hypothetical protein BWX88_05325 [Planctomycetes bacterium ADurb.Bin126]|nr:MAG: hypothetical protein BWX88_05325 [Planctomycetes bacterium ADurb.Bin126]
MFMLCPSLAYDVSQKMKLISVNIAAHSRTRIRRAEPGSHTPVMPCGISSGRPPPLPCSPKITGRPAFLCRDA